MKRTIMVVLSATLLLAQSGKPQNAFSPDQIKYGPPPAFVAAGAELAVLEGNPAASTGVSRSG